MLINSILSASALRRRYPLGKIVIQGCSCSLLPLGEKQMSQILRFGDSRFHRVRGSIRASSHRIKNMLKLQLMESWLLLTHQMKKVEKQNMGKY